MQKKFPSHLQYIRACLKSKGFSEHSVKYITQSWRKSTSKQYDLVWKKWIIWCDQREINQIYPSENEVLDYLSDLAEKGRSYSVINSHKSAIGQTLASCGNNLFLSNTIFSRFMKGVFVIKPPRPKYTCTWDVSIVLNWLEKCFSLQNLPLTMKLVALLALSTAQRVQVLKMLKINMLSVFGDYVIFTIDELTKTSKPGKSLQKVRIDTFTNNKLCVVHTMNYYIKQTEKFRKSNRLLVSCQTF